jgi:hypothetical protein
MDSCKIRQYSDMTKCESCGLCWDTNDQYPPDCPVKDFYPNKTEKLSFSRAVFVVIFLVFLLFIGLFLCN